MPGRRRFAACCLSCAVVVTGPAWGQAAAPRSWPPPNDHPHSEAPGADTIVVAGHLPTDFALLGGMSTLGGEDLARELKPQLGEMLSALPGVSASSFAPGASRPILRGLDAERVQVLVDGLGAIDASSVSADHAVALDTLTVDHIDVVHGPAVLLFGGQAIGGAVNVVDKRIPRAVPSRATVAALGSLASASGERAGGAALDVPLGSRLVAHLDGSWRETDDLRVGGRVVSNPLRSELLAAGLDEAAALSGRVPNTSTRSRTLGAGLAFIDAGGHLGVSVQRFATRYGIASRPGAGGEEDVAIDLRQTRLDVRGGVELGGLFDRLQFRAAYGDYGHVELEGSGVGTRFDRKGLEGRLELVRSGRGPWHGHLGVQYAARSLHLAGDEAIVPDNADTRLGLFTLQGVDIGRVTLEGAARYERATVRTRGPGFGRSFDLVSGALGASLSPAAGWKLGGSYLHGARAPAAEELLSNGLHLATQAFEIGDPGFVAETSDGLELYARYDGKRARLSLTAFATDFADFIAEQRTGGEVDGFPVFRFTQLPARFRGFEADGAITAVRWRSGGLRLEAGADYVRARLAGGEPVPRIAPLRLRTAAEATWRGLTLRGEVERHASQQRVAGGDQAVPGFTLLGASVAWHPGGAGGGLLLILNGENLFDVVGRRATSFTRDYVPIAGRDIRLTASLRF